MEGRREGDYTFVSYSVKVCNLLSLSGANWLRLRGIMIGHLFHVNMKVQTAMCKDNNNSKSRAATYVKFDIYL